MKGLFPFQVSVAQAKYRPPKGEETSSKVIVDAQAYFDYFNFILYKWQYTEARGSVRCNPNHNR